MKRKCAKKSNTCLHIHPATCTKYEGELNSKSELDTCDTNIEETTEELYKQLEELYEELDMTEVGESCLILDNKKIKTILKAMEEEICSLKEEIEELKEFSPCDIKVNTINCPLDLTGIEDECGESITNLNQVLQHLLNIEVSGGTGTGGTGIGGVGLTPIEL